MIQRVLPAKGQGNITKKLQVLARFGQLATGGVVRQIAIPVEVKVELAIGRISGKGHKIIGIIAQAPDPVEHPALAKIGFLSKIEDEIEFHPIFGAQMIELACTEVLETYYFCGA